MDRRGIYVSLSRVEQGLDLRLLLTGSTNSDKWESLAYIVNLMRDATTQAYFAGFERTPDKGINYNWMENKWSSRMAYDEYRQLTKK